MKRILGFLALAFMAAGAGAQTTLYLRSTLKGATPSGDGAQARGLSTTRGSSLTTYTKSTINGPVGDLGTSTQMTTSGGGARISFLSDPWRAATINGTISIQLSGFESDAAANATLTLELLRTDINGTILGSPIASAIRSNQELTTSTGFMSWTVATVPTSLNTNDRLLARVYVDDAYGTTQATGYSAYLRFNGPSNNQAGDSKITLGTNLTASDTTATLTATISATFTATPTYSPTRSLTFTESASPTASASFTPTRSLTFTGTSTATPTFTATSTCSAFSAGPVVTGSGGSVTISWTGSAISTGSIIYSLKDDLSSPTTVTDVVPGTSHAVALSLTAQCTGQRVIYYMASSDSGAETCGTFSFQICSNATLTPTFTISQTPGTSLNCKYCMTPTPGPGGAGLAFSGKRSKEQS